MTIINVGGTPSEVCSCPKCGVFYTVPEVVMSEQRAHGGFHYCPNGHGWGWNENSVENTLRRERDRLKQEQARLIDRQNEIARERDAEAARAAEAEKKLLAAKRRAVAGVCPCCSRTFSNVQRHMASKHKNVVPLAQKAAT